MTSQTKLWALSASALALSLALAGCGGGGSGSSPAAAVSGGGGGGGTTTTAEGALTLPAGHGLAAGEHSIDAGMSLKVAGTRFRCYGTEDCTVTVTGEGDAVAATHTGMVGAYALDATGAQSFANLSDALLMAGAYDESDSLTRLMTGLYHEDPDVLGDNPDTDDVETEFVVRASRGSGVTSSVTTHDQPESATDAEAVTGVSDIAVIVTPTVKRGEDDVASKTVERIAGDGDVVQAEPDATPPVTGIAAGDLIDQTIMDPVLVGTSGRTADFVADADWYRNPADNWITNPALVGADQNMEDLATDDLNELPETGGDIWSHYFQLEGQPLEGGRSLHLDLRSDFNPNHSGPGTAMNIARGPDDTGTPDKIPVDADMVSFDDIEIGVGAEIDIPAAGVKGAYMGVQGTFTCIDTGMDEQGICRVNQHTPGELVPSEDQDLLVFTPDVYMDDTDWLAAGVWLTVPDDEEQGDYAIGAFVFGNMPYNLDSDARTAAMRLTGTADYRGEAFGRYAEVDGDHTEVGRFTADALLEADFGTDAEMGSMTGELGNFVANGQAEEWDVNFERAEFGVEMMVDPNDAEVMVPVDDTSLRYNAGASGHARGHTLDGYWNGQFYGPTTRTVDNADTAVQPGSAAGTFGLTDRDKTDDYSLTVGGAFVTHKQDPAE